MAKGSKLKFRMFWGLIAMFIEVIGEKTGRGGGGHLRLIMLTPVSYSTFRNLLFIIYLLNIPNLFQLFRKLSQIFLFHK